jgi:hypothetical protein
MASVNLTCLALSLIGLLLMLTGVLNINLLTSCTLFIVPLLTCFSVSPFLTAMIGIIRYHMASRTAMTRRILHQEITNYSVIGILVILSYEIIQLFYGLWTHTPVGNNVSRCINLTRPEPTLKIFSFINVLSCFGSLLVGLGFDLAMVKFIRSRRSKAKYINRKVARY